jgi:putative oxidoreductase
MRFPAALIGRFAPIEQNPAFARYAPLALRLIVGFGFMQHGYAKLARGPDDFVQIVHALGLPFPELLAWATIAVEILGGATVLLGGFVALASIPMAFVLLVAIFTVHLPNGFSSIKLQAITASGAQFGQPGYETDLLYLACLIALVLGGSGPWSIDRAINQRTERTYP